MHIYIPLIAFGALGCFLIGFALGGTFMLYWITGYWSER